MGLYQHHPHVLAAADLAGAHAGLPISNMLGLMSGPTKWQSTIHFHDRFQSGGQCLPWVLSWPLPTDPEELQTKTTLICWLVLVSGHSDAGHRLCSDVAVACYGRPLGLNAPGRHFDYRCLGRPGIHENASEERDAVYRCHVSGRCGLCLGRTLAAPILA